MRHRSRPQAFTLVEIMIVVLIVGILLAIAVPNYTRAREESRRKSCVANLKQVYSGMQQWALENQKSCPTIPTTVDLCPAYIRSGALPTCPSSGAAYNITCVDDLPTCPTDVTHVHP